MKNAAPLVIISTNVGLDFNFLWETTALCQYFVLASSLAGNSI
jgi:hypothetical protein